MNAPNYNPTPLQQRIGKQIDSGNPRAFAIADLGEGPLLTYKGGHFRLDYVSIILTRGTQYIEIPRLDIPPYLVLLAQEDTRVNLCLYMSQYTAPVFERNMEDETKGQVFAAAFSEDEKPRAIAHALFQPTFSKAFVLAGGQDSLIMEENPDLCNHCGLCAVMIEELLWGKKRGEANGL